MNERIKELAIQAALAANEDPNGEYPAHMMEKFAELIVRECIDLAKICECIDGSRNPDPYNEGCNDAIRITIERIEAHFGVE